MGYLPSCYVLYHSFVGCGEGRTPTNQCVLVKCWGSLEAHQRTRYRVISGSFITNHFNKIQIRTTPLFIEHTQFDIAVNAWVLSVFDITVFHSIIVNIINMALKIKFIAQAMFPASMLPYRLLFLCCRWVFCTVGLSGELLGKCRFDESPTCWIIAVVFRQCPDKM